MTKRKKSVALSKASTSTLCVLAADHTYTSSIVVCFKTNDLFTFWSKLSDKQNKKELRKSKQKAQVSDTISRIILSF